MRPLLLAFAVVLLSACKGDDPGKPGAAAGAPGPVKYTTGDKNIAGDYDGTKALLTKSGFGKWKLYVAKNCPAFSCANVSKDAFGSDAVKATCPQGAVLEMTLEKELAKGSKQPFTSIVCAEGNGSAHGLVLSDAAANEVEVLAAGETVVAKVNVKSSESVNGVVGAKVCK